MKLALILLALALPAAAQVTFDSKPGSVAVVINGQPFTTFYFGPDSPKPYLHPLTSAEGKRITRVFPMENVPGETRDHPHHRGLWFTHGDVNGLDFWMNEKVSQNAKMGVIANGKVLKAAGGKKKGVIESSCDWQNPAGKTILTEKRLMTFHAEQQQRVVDFDVTFTAVEQVKFGDTKEGFFAVRLRDELSESKGTGTLVNAEGQQKMAKVWGARSPWVDYSGTLEGATIGIAILDHPGNPKHPTFWHARDYGLFAANPFGEHDFLRDKAKDGSITLDAGKALRFRFRVIIHAGDAKSAHLDEQYREYK